MTCSIFSCVETAIFRSPNRDSIKEMLAIKFGPFDAFLSCRARELSALASSISSERFYVLIFSPPWNKNDFLQCEHDSDFKKFITILF